MKNIPFSLLILLMPALLLNACTPAAPTENPAAAAPSAYPAGAEAHQAATVYQAAPVLATPPAPLTPEVPPSAAAAGIPLYSLRIFANGQGWASNWNQTALYHSADGGLSWADVSPAAALAGASGGFYSFYLDGSTAWLSVPTFESSMLLHSSNAGATWTTTVLDFPAGDPQFLDGQNGFLLSRLGAGAGSEYIALYQTADSGATWELRFSHEAGGADPSLPAGGQKTGFVFPVLNKGWVSGSVPINDFVFLYRSTNSGEFWFLVDVSMPDGDIGAMFESFPPAFFSSTEAILPLRVYLPTGSPQTWFYQSVDGGETWTFLSGALPSANHFVFADAQHWWLLGEFGLFRTRDGGASWEDHSDGLPGGFTPLTLDFPDADNGWMLASPEGDTSMESNYLFHSADGGLHWELLPAFVAD